MGLMREGQLHATQSSIERGRLSYNQPDSKLRGSKTEKLEKLKDAKTERLES